MRASRGQVASLAFTAAQPEDDLAGELARSTARQLAPDTGLQQDTGMSL
jgi:hypothetical protein